MARTKKTAKRGRNWIDFEALKSALSLADVLAHYDVQLRGSGDQKHGFCPLPTHTGSGRKKKSPSFSANLSKNAWHCFGCGAKGNALELAVRLEGHDPADTKAFRSGAIAVRDAFGLDLKESAERPAEKPKSSDTTNTTPRRSRRATKRSAASADPSITETDERVEEEATADVTASVETVANAPLDFTLKQLDPDHPYLAERGFGPETISHFGLGYCERGLMNGRIAIPIRDPNGTLLAYAGRLVDDEAVDADNPKYRFPGPREKDGKRFVFEKSRLLYNIAGLHADGDLIIVEGFPACWWLWQHGHERVVALMGSSISDTQADLILHHTAKQTRLVFMPDGDDAGRRCTTHLFAQLGPHRWCRCLQLPDGQQPTDFTREQLRELW